MASKKSKLDKATDVVAKIIQGQLATLPPEIANAKRKELHDLAAKVSPSSMRGKRSRLCEPGVFVEYPDPAQELHKFEFCPVLE